METREGHGLEVRPGPDLVVTTVPGSSAAPDGPPPTPPRRRLVVGLAALLALVLAGVLVLVLALGGDDEPVKASSPAAGPAAPAALGMTVELPDTVVAGRTAEIVVRWVDGEGVFSGTSEDWGDGVGTSSLAQDQCTGAATDRRSADTYTLKHAWSEPGSYQVVLGVTTYVCTDGTAVQEDVSKTVTVQVRPAG